MQSFKIRYGPWAVIAGASEGLGAAFAESLAGRGINLILLARSVDKLSALAVRLRAEYAIEVAFHGLDLADEESVRHFINDLKQTVGLLIYNAAHAPIGYFADIPEDSLLKVVDVNIKAPLLLSRLLAESMQQRGQGGMILMSSLAGTQGSPKIAAYAASKAFNTILAEGLWAELRPHGIDVLAVCAGAVRTPGYEQAKLKQEAPGTLSAESVAEQALQALGKGPTVTPGRTNKIARFLMGRILPKKRAISIMEKNTKHLS